MTINVRILADRVAQARNHGRSKCEIWNKMAVHNVHMQPVTAIIEHLQCIITKMRQVARQERWADYRRRWC